MRGFSDVKWAAEVLVEASNLRSAERASDIAAWRLGDLLHYGEQNFPEALAVASEITGIEPGRLRHRSSVSRRVPPSHRHPRLSWAHHRLVAPHADEQVELLALAFRYVWDYDEFRRELRHRRHPEAFPNAEAVL